MKKISLLLLVLCIALVGCTNKGFKSATPKPPEDVEKTVQEENIENIPDISEERVIKPLKSGIDIENIDDAIINIYFEIDRFDFEEKTLVVDVFERDIYDAIEISNMKVGDTIIVEDTEFPVESISEENGFVDINGGYTYSEFGMTFTPNDGGTYRTLLLDDYATFSKIGSVKINISDDFKLIDYTDGDYGNDGVSTDLDGLQEFLLNLEEWHNCFDYQNTEARIVDNQIVEIIRYWVP